MFLFKQLKALAAAMDAVPSLQILQAEQADCWEIDFKHSNIPKLELKGALLALTSRKDPSGVLDF